MNRRLYPLISTNQAIKANLLTKIGEYWVTPYGEYKRLGNAKRFLLKYHGPIHRKYDFTVKSFRLEIERKPFLLRLRVGKVK